MRSGRVKDKPDWFPSNYANLCCLTEREWGERPRVKSHYILWQGMYMERDRMPGWQARCQEAFKNRTEEEEEEIKQKHVVEENLRLEK